MAKVFAESLGFAGKFWADVREGTTIAALAARALLELGVLPEQVRDLEEKDLVPRLLRHLQQGRYLLAIDNLESVLTAAGDWKSGYEAFLDGFQALGSASVVLLGSREYPSQYFGWQQSRWLTVEQGLEPAEGAALLAALEVEDTEEQRQGVSVQVQGNPLALALIAGWLRQQRPGNRTVTLLQHHPDLGQLAGTHRKEGQISVERVLQWSFDRLTPENQHLLTQISVLRGAFDAEVAAALAPEQSVGLPNLDDLERRSLLQALPQSNPGSVQQFRLQPRIREWVQKRADLTPAHTLAIAYFWSHRPREFAKEDTLDAISDYEDTFYHQCQLGRYEAALATVLACAAFLRRRGYYQTLAALYGPLHTHWQPTPAQRQDYAAVCGSLGNAYQSLGQYQQAIDLQQQWLEIARAIGDRGGEARSLGSLGNAYQSLGQYQQAIDLQQQSLEIARAIGDRGGEARSLGNLGVAYQSLGQYQQAIDLQQQSLEIARAIGDRQGEGTSLFNMGFALARLDQHDEALQSYQQALAIYEELKLDHMVEQCQTAIAEHTQPAPRSTRSPLKRWQKWGLWFAVGGAIALGIWWLRR